MAQDPKTTDTSSRPTGRRILAWLLAVTCGVYLAVAVVWSVANLRDIPHYGDTFSYVRFASVLQVNEHRGIVYPYVLAVAASGLDIEISRRHVAQWRKGLNKEEADPAKPACAFPDGWVLIQLLQVAISFASLGYFIRVVQRLTATPHVSRFFPWVFVSLVAVDPLVNHYNYALMTDGLACSLSLVFCAALAEIGLARRPLWRPTVVLLLSFALVSGLRVEKRWVLLATALSCLGVWAFLAWRRWATFERGRAFRWSVAALVAMGGAVLAGQVQDRVSVKSNWWSLVDTTWHFRLIYNHLGEVYDDLPESVQTVLSRQDAKAYDGNINAVRKVVNRVTEGDDNLRRQLTEDILPVVLRRKGGVILLDIIRDSAENFLATASFYNRVVVRSIESLRPLRQGLGPDAARWNYHRMVMHHPYLTKVYMGLSIWLLCLSLPLAVVALLRFARSEETGKWRVVATWAPAVLFWLLNSLAFGLAVNIINVRYMIFSHAMILLLIYGPACRWCFRVIRAKEFQ